MYSCQSFSFSSGSVSAAPPAAAGARPHRRRCRRESRVRWRRCQRCRRVSCRPSRTSSHPKDRGAWPYRCRPGRPVVSSAGASVAAVPGDRRSYRRLVLGGGTARGAAGAHRAPARRVAVVRSSASKEPSESLSRLSIAAWRSSKSARPVCARGRRVARPPPAGAAPRIRGRGRLRLTCRRCCAAPPSCPRVADGPDGDEAQPALAAAR